MRVAAKSRHEEGRLVRHSARNAFPAFSAILLLTGLAAPPVNAQAPGQQDVSVAMQRTADLMRSPVQITAQYDYTMTARVRLLLFWVGKDDVGGGYIRRGTLSRDPASDVIELLMGSDPAKAPRAINRWGAASEIVHKAPGSANGTESGEFFGFMKVSGGASAAEMEKELAREKRGGSFLFSAIINQGDRNFDFAKVVPFSSETDFTIHQFDQAKSIVFDRLLGSDGRLREIPSSQVQSCSRREGFLETVADLVEPAIEGREAGHSLCYFYNGVEHELKLAQTTRVPAQTVKLTLRDEPHEYVRNYQNLVLARFENFDHTSKKVTEFELLLGMAGNLRGVPIQIHYQPNWWFQVVLNLITPKVPVDGQIP